VINISSGQFLYNYNAAIAGGTLNLKLNQAATIRATGGAAPTSYSFPLNANGKVAAINAAVSSGAYVWKLFPNVTEQIKEFWDKENQLKLGAPIGNTNATKNNADNISIESDRSFGTSQSYLRRRLLRDKPKLYKRVIAGALDATSVYFSSPIGNNVPNSKRPEGKPSIQPLPNSMFRLHCLRQPSCSLESLGDSRLVFRTICTKCRARNSIGQGMVGRNISASQLTTYSEAAEILNQDGRKARQAAGRAQLS
jgi:hypothetical protein